MVHVTTSWKLGDDWVPWLPQQHWAGQGAFAAALQGQADGPYAW